MASVSSVHGVASDPLADSSRPAQSRRVLGKGEPLEWKTPGSHMRERLSGSPELLHLFEQMGHEGHLVLVFLKQENDRVLDAIFDAQRELYSLFPASSIDVRVTRKPENWDFSALQSSSIAWF